MIILTMITSIIEKLIGGSMDKMMKNNNKLTFLTFLLVLAGVYIGYVNMLAIAESEKKADARYEHIQAAFYYKFSIDIDQPFQRQPSNRRDDSSSMSLHRDVLLNETKQLVQKKE